MKNKLTAAAAAEARVAAEAEDAAKK